MVLGNPGLVINLSGAGGDTSRLGTRKGLSNLDSLLSLLGGAGTLGLGKEGLDPGLVDEVEGTGKGTGKEEVEEDAVQKG